MKNSKFFLFLTILLAPLYVVRFNVGSYPSTLLEVLIGLTVVSWVVEKVQNEGLKVKGIKGINITTILFLLAATVSVVISSDRYGALGIFKAYFIEPVLIYIVIRSIVKSKKDWWLVFWALALSGLWVALLAVFQRLVGWPVFSPHEAALGRAHGVYNTANAVGLYLGPIVFLLLGIWRNLKITPQISKLRWATAFAVAVMTLAIILSKSAGAMVGLVVGLGVFGVLKFLGMRKGVRVVAVTGLVLAIVGVWFFFSISNFTPQVADPYIRKSDDTLAFRLCLWEGARDLLLDKPVFGAGLSGFKELYSQKYFTCDAEPLEYPHNWILNFWTELGMLGLVAFLLILWRYFKSVRGAFIAAMVYWLIHGLVDVPYFKNDLSLEFWVIVGLAETLGLAF